jgi:hypothetical protein
VAINALSYAVIIAGGVALMKRRPEFSLPAIFFAVMGVMYNGIQHPIYSYMVRGSIIMVEGAGRSGVAWRLPLGNCGCCRSRFLLRAFSVSFVTLSPW